jgi:hypothetical protein
MRTPARPRRAHAFPPGRADPLLLASLDLQTTLFHLGQYCGSWKASTSGLARAGFHLVLDGECWLHLPQQDARQKLKVALRCSSCATRHMR